MDISFVSVIGETVSFMAVIISCELFCIVAMMDISEAFICRSMIFPSVLKQLLSNTLIVLALWLRAFCDMCILYLEYST